MKAPSPIVPFQGAEGIASRVGSMTFMETITRLTRERDALIRAVNLAIADMPEETTTRQFCEQVLREVQDA